MKILIADDHPLTLYGTKSYLESLSYHVDTICHNGITAWNMIEMRKPDIAILDINMPGMDGMEIAAKVKAERKTTKIILLTMHNDRGIYLKSLELGVYGYLLKNFSTEDLDTCIQKVSTGEKYFSPNLESQLQVSNNQFSKDVSSLSLTERKIVELISQAKNSRQIATMLFISEKTVENHRRNIIEKLDLPKEKNSLLTWALKNSR
ncbi:MAG: response regulator [Fluviicola sp.]